MGRKPVNWINVDVRVAVEEVCKPEQPGIQHGGLDMCYRYVLMGAKCPMSEVGRDKGSVSSLPTESLVSEEC